MGGQNISGKTQNLSLNKSIDNSVDYLDYRYKALFDENWEIIDSQFRKLTDDAGEQGIGASVKAFGAAGDGSTPDSDAIQSAIDYVESKGGGIVFFPKGTYLLDKAIKFTKKGIIFTGEGKNSMLMQDATMQETSFLTSLATEREDLYLDNVIIENLNFVGTEHDKKAIQISGFTESCVIRDCFFDSLATGIELYNSWSYSLERNNINDCTTAGMKLGYLDGTISENNSANIYANTIKSSKAAIDIAKGNGNYIHGNTFELNDRGLVLNDLSGVSIVHNNFKTNNIASVTLGSNSGFVRNYLMLGNSFYETDASKAPVVFLGAYNGRIMSNNFDGNTTRPFKVEVSMSSRVYNNYLEIKATDDVAPSTTGLVYASLDFATNNIMVMDGGKLISLSGLYVKNSSGSVKKLLDEGNFSGSAAQMTFDSGGLTTKTNVQDALIELYNLVKQSRTYAP
jgi:hypothetical protein